MKDYRDDYYDTKGGCMAKAIFILMFIFAITTTWAQPIKTGPVKNLFEGYNPQQPLIIEKAVPGPRGPQGIPGKSVAIIKADTVPIIVTNLPEYVKRSDMDNILYDNFGNVYFDMTTIRNAVNGIDSSNRALIHNMGLNMEIHRLKNAGTTKILSGIGLQAVALGLVAYANVDIVTNANVYMAYPISYTTKEYTLSETKYTSDDKCKFPHCDTSHDQYRYTISTKDVDKVTHVAVNDNFPCITERNKGAYYTAAGILAGAGVVLEVLGIIDLHNAHVYSNHNSVGVQVNF